MSIQHPISMNSEQKVILNCYNLGQNLLKHIEILKTIYHQINVLCDFYEHIQKIFWISNIIENIYLMGNRFYDETQITVT